MQRSSLKDLEHRVQKAAQKALPSVVAVESPNIVRGPYGDNRFASGVIITADGLVLSQCHVSHGMDYGGSQKSRIRKPGERAKVILCDRRTCEAELLAQIALRPVSSSPVGAGTLRSEFGRR